MYRHDTPCQTNFNVFFSPFSQARLAGVMAAIDLQQGLVRSRTTIQMLSWYKMSFVTGKQYSGWHNESLDGFSDFHVAISD
jgi:hypothetical protein